MRILYFAPSTGVYTGQPTGAGPHIRGVISALQARGHVVDTVFGGDIYLAAHGQTDETTPPQAITRWNPLRTVVRWLLPVNLRNDLSILRFNSRIRAQAAQVVRKTSPNLIYERNAYLNSDGLRLARWFGLPYVLESDAQLLELQNTEWGSMLRYWADRIDQRKHEQADVIVVPSEYAREVLTRKRGLDSARIFVKELGVDLELFQNLPEKRAVIRRQFGLTGRCVVGYVGSFRKYHDVALLLEAAARLKARGDQRLIFLLVGAGGLLETYRKQVATQRLDNVIFTGLVPHERVPEYVSAMDVTVIPGSGVTVLYPIKLLEYGAMGKPVVVPRLELFRGVVEDRQMGIYFEPGNVESLLQGLELLADDGGLRQALGWTFQQRVRTDFSWARVAERMDDALHTALA